MNYEIGDQVHHVDYPTSAATVVRFPAPFRVLVCWENTGRTSEESVYLIERHN